MELVLGTDIGPHNLPGQLRAVEICGPG